MVWAPDYVTSTELKDFVRISDGVDDDEVAFVITAASRAVDQTTNRQFGLLAAVESRFYTAEFDRRRGRWIISIDDLMTETGLTVNADLDDDDTFDDPIDVFRLEPVNAEVKSRPWTRIMVKPDSANLPSANVNALVEVTAQFGWTAVPETIETATLLQASRFLARRDSPYGIAGSPDMGSEQRLLAKLDPDVAVMVGSYRRWWAAV